MLGIGAMLVASKYEEIYAPEIRDFIYVSAKSYSKEQILLMEYNILRLLNFDILCVNPYSLLRRYSFVINEDIQCFYLSQFILECTLIEYKMINYKTSLKCAASIFIAKKILKKPNIYSNCLFIYAGYEEREIKLCAREICKLLESINKTPYQACRTKFSQKKFLEVGKIKFYD